MKKFKINNKPLCPHCLKQVVKSEIDGYSWQCLECYEDFTDFECTYKVITEIVSDNFKKISLEYDKKW